MNSILQEHAFIFMAALIIWVIVSFVALSKGFYHLPEKKKDPAFFISSHDLLTVFGIFFGIELLIVPLLAGFWLVFAGQISPQAEYKGLDIQTQGWLNLMAIFFSALGILLYACTMKPMKRVTVFWGGEAPKKGPDFYKDLGIGALTWVLSYPLVIMTSQVIETWLYFAGYEQQIDQVAVKNLKSVMPYPFLLSCTLLTIVLIVPIAEEILFRGFFQNWGVQKMGRFKGIIAASLLFASFHFSMSQDWTNIELLLSLFILSCYLGFVYERQRSLWASTALHSTFNAISVLIIMLQG
jgi:membrane protease YdiL (CAAX protease family)